MPKPIGILENIKALGASNYNIGNLGKPSDVNTTPQKERNVILTFIMRLYTNDLQTVSPRLNKRNAPVSTPIKAAKKARHDTNAITPVQEKRFDNAGSSVGGSPAVDEITETPTQKATRRQRERRATAKEAAANGEPKIDGSTQDCIAVNIMVFPRAPTALNRREDKFLLPLVCCCRWVMLLSFRCCCRGMFSPHPLGPRWTEAVLDWRPARFP